MKSSSIMIAIAGAIFAVFFANVALGASDQPKFLGDVGEMIVLLAVTIFFVSGVLLKEAERRDGAE
ncbi:MAG: hypothetical protein AAF638_02275 [Pseudomonadota bacterium]